ncbi:MAG: hypothetical protein IKF82_01270 [Bacilli bacterium]|nr:hypothetical protein [Bacilli bacterium]
MASSNKPAGNKKNIGIIIVTTVFAIIGLACIIIGYGSEFLTWLGTFGVVILVLVSPILVFLLYKIVIGKIKDM